MNAQVIPPIILEKRSDEREVFRLVNALRDRAIRGEQHFQSDLVDLTVAGTTPLLIATQQKFVPHLVDFVVVGLSGVHATSAVVSVGDNATFNNLVNGYSISTAVVADQLVGISLIPVVTALGGDITASWTGATGAGLVLTGFFDIMGYWQQ